LNHPTLRRSPEGSSLMHFPSTSYSPGFGRHLGVACVTMHRRRFCGRSSQARRGATYRRSKKFGARHPLCPLRGAGQTLRT